MKIRHPSNGCIQALVNFRFVAFLVAALAVVIVGVAAVVSVFIFYE